LIESSITPNRSGAPGSPTTPVQDEASSPCSSSASGLVVPGSVQPATPTMSTGIEDSYLAASEMNIPETELMGIYLEREEDTHFLHPRFVEVYGSDQLGELRRAISDTIDVDAPSVLISESEIPDTFWHPHRDLLAQMNQEAVVAVMRTSLRKYVMSRYFHSESGGHFVAGVSGVPVPTLSTLSTVAGVAGSNVPSPSSGATDDLDTTLPGDEMDTTTVGVTPALQTVLPLISQADLALLDSPSGTLITGKTVSTRKPSSRPHHHRAIPSSDSSDDSSSSHQSAQALLPVVPPAAANPPTLRVCTITADTEIVDISDSDGECCPHPAVQVAGSAERHYTREKVVVPLQPVKRMKVVLDSRGRPMLKKTLTALVRPAGTSYWRSDEGEQVPRTPFVRVKREAQSPTRYEDADPRIRDSTTQTRDYKVKARDGEPARKACPSDSEVTPAERVDNAYTQAPENQYDQPLPRLKDVDDDDHRGVQVVSELLVLTGLLQLADAKLELCKRPLPALRRGQKPRNPNRASRGQAAQAIAEVAAAALPLYRFKTVGQYIQYPGDPFSTPGTPDSPTVSTRSVFSPSSTSKSLMLRTSFSSPTSSPTKRPPRANLVPLFVQQL
jgi:hypothetical protein